MPEDPAPHRIKIDREMCQTAATCLSWNFYELDDEAKAVLLTRNGLNSDDPENDLADQEGFVEVSNLVESDKISTEEMQALVMESAKACPFNAIIVHDKEGNQLWPPL